ncbi:MAG: carboxypeptidase regulatory-like domain-containing protein [Acidobacteriales bacterium]|nr:carboxypeptidase regulatory-like domain-containing protein [Terriglobales bacterium]
MSGRHSSILLAAVFVVLTAAVPAFGQGAALGSISGRVTDPSQAPVPDAGITVTNTKTGSTSTAATTADGYYTVRFLQPGTYSVSVTKTGFQKSVQPDVLVATATSPTVNITLTLGAVAETVTVTERVAQIETQNADKGAIIDNIRMLNTPTQGHNIMGITWAAAGVTVATNAKSFTPYDNSGSTSLVISGGQFKSNEMLIDGVPNRGGNEGGLYGTIPTQETVAEMKVLASPYSAEYGRTTGGVVNVTTRSGNNDYHGETYWYNRNVTLAANTFERNLAKLGRLPVHFDQYGFLVSGPAFKNKLFFSSGWQRLHSGSKKSYSGHVPTEAERNGDFTDTWWNSGGQKAPVLIYDPWSIKQDPVTGRYSRTALAGNKVPASRMSPVAKAFWKYIPMPNATGDPITRGSNYLPSGGSAKADFSEYSNRVDWNINDTNRFSVRHIRNNFNSYDVEFYPGAADVNTGFPFTRANHNLVVDYTRTISPTSVLNVRAGLQRYLTANINNKRGEVTPKDLGFGSTFVAQASPYFPYFSFGGSPGYGGTGFSGAGQGSGNFTPDQINNVDATWSKIIGKHTLKIGGQGRLERTYNVAAGYNAGNFGFSPTATNQDPQVNVASAGDSVASFLMGVGSASIDVLSLPARQGKSLALFVQDDISVTSKLKINLGLRWDWTGPMTDRYNAMTGMFDETATSPLAAQVKAAAAAANCPACANLRGGLTFPGVGGMPRNVYNASRKNFGPRFGFAYALDNKTAIRGGFGMFYGPIWYDPGQPAGYSQTTSSILYDANLIPINLIDNPFPTGLLQPTGSSKGLATNIGAGISFIDPETREPRAYQASFEIQREIPWGVLVSAGYNFNYNDRLPVNQSLNYIAESLYVQGASVLNRKVDNPFAGLVPGYALNQSQISFSSLQYQFPQFTGVTKVNVPIGDSRYDGLQTQVTKRFSQGVSMSFGYTVSKKLGHFGYANSFDNFLEKRYEDYDIPQNFVANGSWEMPWGKTRWAWRDMPGWLDHIIGGWQINWMIRVSSGRPYQMGADTIPVAGVDPNDVPGGQRLDQWVNRAAYTLNTNPYAPRRWYTMTGRLREPPTHNFDLGIMKNFRITERVKFQFINNWVNAFNTPQWYATTGNCATASKSCFGQIAGYQNQSNYPRQIQFAGRISF